MLEIENVSIEDARGCRSRPSGPCGRDVSIFRVCRPRPSGPRDRDGSFACVGHARGLQFERLRYLEANPEEVLSMDKTL